MKITKVQSWNGVSGFLALVFVLVAVHFFDNIWIMLSIAFGVDFVIAAIRFPFFSLFLKIGELLGKLLNNKIFFNIIVIGTAIYFFIGGKWLKGLIVPIYSYVLGPLIFQFPGVFIWDKMLGKPDARIYAYFKLKSKRTGKEMPSRKEMRQVFFDEPLTEEKADILLCIGINPYLM